ncbi:MAG TPA: type II secretion system F family protein [Mycobacteriales bacterium]|nr:type II secretion system F family protein [Mycobacteriales bacterium]
MSGALLGPAVLAGLVLVGVGVPRAPRLADRLGPYVSVEPRPPTRLAALAGTADRLLGGGESVRRRLAVLGDDRPVRDVRVEQLGYGTAGLVAGGAAGAALTVATGRSPAAVLLAVAGAAAGVLGRDVALTRRVRTHRAAVLAEFPVVAELLALAVTAGEGPVGALDRVCRLTGGVLAVDLGATLARVRAGAPLATALEELRDRAGVPVLARFVDGVLVALERGTPLADVLRAQAADVRDAARRALLESGGRREIGMLVPVVFGVLPTTVLFALYPGLAAVSALAGG